MERVWYGGFYGLEEESDYDSEDSEDQDWKMTMLYDLAVKMDDREGDMRFTKPSWVEWEVKNLLMLNRRYRNWKNKHLEECEWVRRNTLPRWATVCLDEYYKCVSGTDKCKPDMLAWIKSRDRWSSDINKIFNG